MVGIVDFFISINKIALLAFVVMLGFLVYEIMKTIKEKKKGEKPIVPQFIDTVQPAPQAAQNSTPLPPMPVAPLKKKERNTSGIVMILIGAASLVGLGVVMVVTFNTKTAGSRIASTTAPIIREISSAGIKLYDLNWIEVNNNKVEAVKPGKKIYISIQTIVEADIDRARIKVNQPDWQISDIATLFNSKLKVYYKEYTIATGTAQLKIDAQLHSASDGWLGD